MCAPSPLPATRAPGRFAPHPMRCSALVPVPPLLRTPRARATRIWRTPESRAEGRPGAQPRITSMPTALPRRPTRARAMLPILSALCRTRAERRYMVDFNESEGESAFLVVRSTGASGSTTPTCSIGASQRCQSAFVSRRGPRFRPSSGQRLPSRSVATSLPVRIMRSGISAAARA